jgi:predicted nucleic acid-binding protein
VNTLVIDASVAAKWFLPAEAEPHAEQALDLLSRYVAGELRFVVPDLFWAELGNIFWKAARQGRWSESDGETAVRALRERRIPSVASFALLDDAFGISIAYDRSVYDSIYVALALASKADLVTADERLANALAAHLPVKWLGYFA